MPLSTAWIVKQSAAHRWTKGILFIAMKYLRDGDIFYSPEPKRNNWCTLSSKHVHFMYTFCKEFVSTNRVMTIMTTFSETFLKIKWNQNTFLKHLYFVHLNISGFIHREQSVKHFVQYFCVNEAVVQYVKLFLETFLKFLINQNTFLKKRHCATSSHFIHSEYLLFLLLSCEFQTESLPPSALDE